MQFGFCQLRYLTALDSLLQSIWTGFTFEYSNESIANCNYTASIIEFIRDYNSFDDGRLQAIPSKIHQHSPENSTLPYGKKQKNAEFVSSILDYSVLYSGQLDIYDGCILVFGLWFVESICHNSGRRFPTGEYRNFSRQKDRITYSRYKHKT